MLQLFLSFFKIGTFTIGGGFAMIPLMHREVVERHDWLSDEQFVQQVSLSQAMPGVFAVNMAVAIGYRLRGLRGATSAVVGATAMPIIIILLLAILFNHFRGNSAVEHIFMGLRPAVVALIAAPVFNMARAAHIGWSNCWIPIAAALLIWLCGVSPIWVILGAVISGFTYGQLASHKSKQS